MHDWRQKYLFTGTLSVLLVLSAFKYYNKYKVTAPEAASTVLREVVNEKKVFSISEEHMKSIKELYDSLEIYKLPHIEITNLIHPDRKDVLEEVIFTNDIDSDRWIVVPRTLGDTDETYFERNSKGHYLLQDINIESSEDSSHKNLFTVTATIKYSEYKDQDMIRSYLGSVTLTMKKLSINQWKVENVETVPFAMENYI